MPPELKTLEFHLAGSQRFQGDRLPGPPPSGQCQAVETVWSGRSWESLGTSEFAGRARLVLFDALERCLVASAFCEHPDKIPSVIRQEALSNHDREHEATREIVAALAVEPIEDGVTHPVEDLLRTMLRDHRQSLIQWMLDLLDEDGKADVASACLKCLGRLHPREVSSWGPALASEALDHQDVEVRDSAIQALELWATPPALRILRQHRDPEPWLAEYAQRVVRGIERRGCCP